MCSRMSVSFQLKSLLCLPFDQVLVLWLRRTRSAADGRRFHETRTLPRRRRRLFGLWCGALKHAVWQRDRPADSRTQARPADTEGRCNVKKAPSCSSWNQ